jgi:hypothetical protein
MLLPGKVMTQGVGLFLLAGCLRTVHMAATALHAAVQLISTEPMMQPMEQSPSLDNPRARAFKWGISVEVMGFISRAKGTEAHRARAGAVTHGSYRRLFASHGWPQKQPHVAQKMDAIT